MCLVISLFCLFYFHVKSLNFIFYLFVKSIVHQSYDQSIGCIYTSVNLKENQLNWVDELLTVEIKITITFDEKTNKENSSSVNQHSLTFDTDLYSYCHISQVRQKALYSCAFCMDITMARLQLVNVNAHIDPPRIFYLVLKITHINSNYYSFKIFPQFLLAKSTRIIHHNQSPMTKFGRIWCLTRK